MKVITKRQKLIRFADHSPYGWGVVEEYLQEDIAKDEKEAKKWADAEKLIEAKMHRKRTLDDRGHSDRDPQHTRPMPPPSLPPVFVPPPPPHQPVMSSRAFEPVDPHLGYQASVLTVYRWDTLERSAHWEQTDLSFE